MSLVHGALTISGRDANGSPVSATGRLRVALRGSPSRPELAVTEEGLSNVESALGVVSPFDVNGAPALLRISTVRSLAQC
jgi:hypothetical protein